MAEYKVGDRVEVKMAEKIQPATITRFFNRIAFNIEVMYDDGIYGFTDRLHLRPIEAVSMQEQLLAMLRMIRAQALTIEQTGYAEPHNNTACWLAAKAGTIVDWCDNVLGVEDKKEGD